MPKIRNISNTNIIIKGKTLYPDKIMTIDDIMLEDLENLIEKKYIEVDNSISESLISNDNSGFNSKGEYEEVKSILIPSLFSLYLHEDLNIEQLNALKWFYQNVGPTSIIDKATKELLNDVENTEEFIEVLLNHIYPELIKLNKGNKK